MEEMQSPKNRVWLKVVVIVVAEIVAFITLLFVGGLILTVLEGSENFPSIPLMVIGALLFLFSWAVAVYLSMVLLSKKFVSEDAHLIPKHTTAVLVATGVATLIVKLSFETFLLQIIIYPTINYVVSSWYLRNKFKNPALQES